MSSWQVAFGHLKFNYTWGFALCRQLDACLVAWCYLVFHKLPSVWRGCMQPLQSTRLLSSTTGSGGVAYNPSRHSCFLLETANSLTKNPLSGGVVYNPSSPAWSCCEAGPGLIGMSLGILCNDIQQQSRAEPSRSRPMQTRAEQSQAEQ